MNIFIHCWGCTWHGVEYPSAQSGRHGSSKTHCCSGTCGTRYFLSPSDHIDVSRVVDRLILIPSCSSCQIAATTQIGINSLGVFAYRGLHPIPPWLHLYQPTGFEPSQAGEGHEAYWRTSRGSDRFQLRHLHDRAWTTWHKLMLDCRSHGSSGVHWCRRFLGIEWL